jgi:hypothetical protein
LGTAMPSPGQALEALGYGSTPTLNPSRVFVRLGGATRIVDLVQNSNTLIALKSQGFPDVKAPIINIDAPLTPGDSGAPLIDDAGAVVGVANGNLLQGTLPYSWAFPATTIRDLVAAKGSPLPASLVIVDVLVTEEVPTGSAVLPARNTSNNTVICGMRTFQFRGTQTYSRLVATSDSFSASHIQMVQNFAQMNGMMIRADARFDVYVDPVSGADFVVPSGFGITVSGNDCIATDNAHELEMRISTEAVANVALSGGPASAFSARTLKPGEVFQPNPQFITPPTPRNDGMVIQRYAYYYGLPGQLPPFNEGYFTLALRRNTMLEVSVRTLKPALATQGNSNVFPSVVSVYAATFAL